MSTIPLRTHVRPAGEGVAVIELTGDVTAACETELMDAYREAGRVEIRGVVLDFTRLDYMNSSGIGLLVTLLVRAKREGKQVSAYGLSDHYRQIFELTRLDEVISVHDEEERAVAAARTRPGTPPAVLPGQRAPGG
jgi:anti-sigma B factor antagonist